jgi:hypothetical protein
LQAFLAKHCIAQVYQQIWLPVTSGFSRTKIAVESEERLIHNDKHFQMESFSGILNFGI